MKFKTKKTIFNVLSIIFGIVLLGAAYNHIVNAEMYTAMVPQFIPLLFADVFAVVSEAVVGILLLVPKTRKYGAIGFTLLMIIFLPLHIWDVFRVENQENPLVKSMNVAVIRLVMQLMVIALGFYMFKFYSRRVVFEG
ncbi:MauE/DoxX family redox-associated membrane protein [Chryseobacterium sp. MP_3.2]|uniref:MauE/DoxX family redox-associated membrane protein n=1 Tax=Chryseobacterium sp. MP_3.2 TaxID=3071712 RepID=UPI002DFC6411|nr:putative membrane protein [Chryseobacterium sp. MP_3.2]